ncbi:MAG: leucine-rich repeat domain-containing protein [Muribaculaceae bacterium]|nr:leucine-rich repeat domain-containing protein [Muribaculaceae bacterium]
MKIRSLLPVAFAMLCMTPAMAQSKKVTPASAGTLATLLTDDEKTSVTELVVSGPVNKTDFIFINTLTALETLDIKDAKVAEETLEGITHPADVLPKEALYKNETIKKLVLPASITSVAENAVDYTSAADIDFSPCVNLKTIQREAFQSNNFLEAINLSGLKSLESIGVSAFNTCSQKAGVTEVTIDLSGCSALKEIEESAFANNKASALMINLSGCASLTTIGDQAFLNGKETSVDLTGCSALETIGKRVFSISTRSLAKITDVKLPASLKTITTEAFRNQAKIANVSILAVTPPTLGATAFYPTDDAYDAILTVPAGSKNAYETNDEWKKFKTIVEAESSSVNEFEAAETSIYAANGIIFVKNGVEGSVVNVYNVSGTLVATGTVAGGEAAIQISTKGICIVQTVYKTSKVSL